MASATDYLESYEGSFPNTWGERSKKFNVRNAYRVVSWVYSCVNCIASCISGTPFVFFTEDSSGKRTPLPPNHPAEVLFRVPNPGVIPSRSEMIRMQIVSHELFGESFMRVVTGGRGRGSRPTVQLLQSYAMKHDVNQKTGLLQKWEYNNPNTSAPPEVIAPEGVTQWKYPNPYDDFRGLAPLTATRLAIEQDINMSVWNAGFFMSGLKNPLALLVKQTLDPRQRKQFIDGILQSFSGFYKGQMPLLLEGGTDVKVLANTMKDLDFIEGKQLTREEILTVYGIPPAQVGIFRYANYASAKEQRVLLYTNNAKPKMIYYRDVFQTNVLDVLFPGVKCDWDWQSIDVLRDDPKIMAEAAKNFADAAKTYYDMGYDRTEIALILKNPDLDPDVSDGTNRPDGGMEAEDEEEENEPEEGTPEDEAEDEAEGEVETSSKGSRRVRLLAHFVKTTKSKTSLIQHIPTEVATAYAVKNEVRLTEAQRVLDAYLRTFFDQALATMAKKEIDRTFWLAAWNKLFKDTLANIYWGGVKSALRNLSRFAEPDGTVGNIPKLHPTDSTVSITIPSEVEDALTPDLEVVQQRSEELAGKIIDQLNEIRKSSPKETYQQAASILLGKIDMMKLVSFAYNRSRYQTFVGAGVTHKLYATKTEKVGKEVAMETVANGVLFPGQAGDTQLDVILPTRVAKERVADFREMA